MAYWFPAAMYLRLVKHMPAAVRNSQRYLTRELQTQYAEYDEAITSRLGVGILLQWIPGTDAYRKRQVFSKTLNEQIVRYTRNCFLSLKSEQLAELRGYFTFLSLETPFNDFFSLDVKRIKTNLKPSLRDMALMLPFVEDLREFYNGILSEDEIAFNDARNNAIFLLNPARQVEKLLKGIHYFLNMLGEVGVSKDEPSTIPGIAWKGFLALVFWFVLAPVKILKHLMDFVLGIINFVVISPLFHFSRSIYYFLYQRPGRSMYEQKSGDACLADPEGFTDTEQLIRESQAVAATYQTAVAAHQAAEAAVCRAEEAARQEKLKTSQMMRVDESTKRVLALFQTATDQLISILTSGIPDGEKSVFFMEVFRIGNDIRVAWAQLAESQANGDWTLKQKDDMNDNLLLLAKTFNRMLDAVFGPCLLAHIDTSWLETTIQASAIQYLKEEVQECLDLANKNFSIEKSYFESACREHSCDYPAVAEACDTFFHSCQRTCSFLKNMLGECIKTKHEGVISEQTSSEIKKIEDKIKEIDALMGTPFYLRAEFLLRIFNAASLSKSMLNTDLLIKIQRQATELADAINTNKDALETKSSKMRMQQADVKVKDLLKTLQSTTQAMHEGNTQIEAEGAVVKTKY